MMVLSPEGEMQRLYLIENKAHWVLDVVYREDDCRIRRGNGAFNVGLVRRLCMNLAPASGERLRAWKTQRCRLE